MKNKICTMLLMVLGGLSLRADTVIDLPEDSLRVLLKENTQASKLRVDVLNELAYLFWNKADRQDSSLLWSLEALRIADSLSYLEGRGDALVRMGLINGLKNQVDAATQYYQQALSIRLDELKNYPGAARVYNNLGELYKQQPGRVKEAIAAYENGLSMLESFPDDSFNAIIHRNLGSCYLDLDEFEKSLEHFKQALEFEKKRKSHTGQAKTKFYFGKWYEKLGRYATAMTSYEQAKQAFGEARLKNWVGKCLIHQGNIEYKQSDFERAMGYYREARSLMNALSAKDQQLLLWNIGATFDQQGQLDSALVHFEESIAFYQTSNNQEALASLLYNIGNVYFQRASFDTAVTFYQQSKVILDSLPRLEVRKDLMAQLSLSYEQLGRLQDALFYNKEYIAIRDELIPKREEGYQEVMDQQDGQMLLMSANNRALKRKNRNMILFSILGGLLLLSFLVSAILLAYNQKKQKQIAKQNEQLAIQEVEEVLANRQLDQAFAYIEGQHEERNRIGQDLHDRLGNMLSMVKLNFQSIDEKLERLEAKGKEHYDKANGLLDAACEEVRRVAHQLQSGILEKFGLKMQLEEMVSYIEGTGRLEVELSLHSLDQRLPQHLEVQIYRIVQELTNNVIKFAAAEKLSLQVNRFNRKVNIVVEDDGVGFIVAEALQKRGMGLRSVQKRVEQMEGELLIDAEPGRGASFIIDIPLETSA